MKKVMDQLAVRLGSQLCGLAEAVASTAVSDCRTKYFQPKEPDGLAEFADRRRRK